jgi:hypothetical protein
VVLSAVGMGYRESMYQSGDVFFLFFFSFGKDLGGRKGLAPCMKKNTTKILTTSHVVERSSGVCLHGCVIFQLPYSELSTFVVRPTAPHCSTTCGFNTTSLTFPDVLGFDLLTFWPAKTFQAFNNHHRSEQSHRRFRDLGRD